MSSQTKKPAAPRNEPESRAVAIVGMHRSGTSMVAKLLHAAGLDLGADADLSTAPAADNQDGFWENTRFVAVNDGLLSLVGAGWDHPPETDAWDLATPDRARLAATAETLIAEFAAADPWGWKDPRTSLTLPFWQSLLPHLRVVLCVRNPLEVAISLHRRNSLSYQLSLRLWADYNRRVLAAVPRERLVVTHYDSFFEESAQETGRLADALDLPAARSDLREASDTPTPLLRHSSFSLSDLIETAVAPELVTLYRSLCELAQYPIGDAPVPDADEQVEQAPLVDDAAVELKLLRRAYAHSSEAPAPAQPEVEAEPEAEVEPDEPPPEVSPSAPAAEELHELALELRAKLDEATARAESLEQEVRERDAIVTDLQSSVETVSEHARKSVADVERRDRTILDLQAELEQLSGHIDRAAADVRQRDGVIRGLQVELADVAAQTEAAVAEVRDRDATVAELRAQLAQLGDSHREAETEAQARDEALRRLESELASLRDGAAATERTLRLRDERIQRLDDSLADAEARARRSAAEAREKDGELTRMAGALALAERKIAGLTDELGTRDSEHAALRKRLDDAEATAAALREDVAARRAEERRLDDELESLRERELRKERDAGDRDREVRDVRDRLARSEAELGELRGVRDRLARSEAELGELRDVRDRLARSEAELRELRTALSEVSPQGESPSGRLLTALEAGIAAAVAAMAPEAPAGPRPSPPAEAAAAAPSVEPPRAKPPVPSGYAELRASIAARATALLPAEPAVAVVSRGDDELVRMLGPRALHYPRGSDGRYAGYHPADSGAAVNHLEELRAAGAEYLLFPSTANWWFGHYDRFARHLERYDLLCEADECRIYDLRRERVDELVETVGPGNGVDVICFPIIDWSFRFQRPQQIATQFARNGHRVFYVATRFQQEKSAPIVEPIADDVYVVRLPGPDHVNLYRDSLDDEATELLLGALNELRLRLSINSAISVVDLPFWAPLALEARSRWGWRVLYDCMDDHGGFATTGSQMLEAEDELVARSDLVVATSKVLYDRVARDARRTILVHNGAEVEHFSKPPDRDPLAHLPRPIVGYYGAIAEWFDTEMIREAARARPDWSFVLIGDTFGAETQGLEALANVHLLGEQPYATLPDYLHSFDVACIPFQLTPLTEATNPVKFYEYLSAGKPVVSVDLPELEAYRSLYYSAADGEGLVRQVEQALREDTPDRAARRIGFARQNAWEQRYESLVEPMRQFYGKAAIVVLSFDNLEYLQLCLDSIWKNTLYPNYEVIVVDNGSSDEVIDYLSAAAAVEPRLRLIVNGENLGFARANNVGLEAAADAEYLFLLNDDTVVTRGWLETLIGHLQDERIGLVGPVSNWAGNEAKIDVPYVDLAEMPAFAETWTREHDGQYFDIDVLAMYCVGIRRNVLEKVGYLNERFEIGMFEDDDFAMRVRKHWYRVVCAEDVFIHHWGRASFSRLDEDVYARIFEQNKKTFEQIWEQPWQPHRHRSESAGSR